MSLLNLREANNQEKHILRSPKPHLNFDRSQDNEEIDLAVDIAVHSSGLFENLSPAR